MTIFRWVLVTALAMAFLLLSVANWTPVPFRLPDGVMVNIRLPLLLGLAFIAGWLPTWLILIGTKATLQRKLGKIERAVEPSRAAPPQPSGVPPVA